MAIKHLTDEQIHTMTIEEKDRWWLENVYQGDVPQFTARAVICGFLLGGVLSITNLYIGAKTGWALGVGITSVILAFVIFKVLSSIGLGRNYHILENNIMQSVACSAGYTNGPLIASMAAYMIVMEVRVPWWQMMLWCFGLAVLGVLFAFPLKRRFINDEQLPFPEGQAAGVVLDSLHNESDDASVDAAMSAKLLLFSGLGAAFLKFFQAEKVLAAFKIPFHIPELLDEWYYHYAEKFGWAIPKILGTDLRELSVRPELDIAMFGAGGLMGIRTGLSLMIGAVINYLILAPAIIKLGDIHGTADAAGVIHFGFGAITKWALWCGVTMMTVASLLSFFSKPAALIAPFKSLFGRRERTDDCLSHVELPLGVSIVGIPLVGGAVVYMAYSFYGVSPWLAALAVPMVFVFTLIAVNSTALTSVTPTGAMGKITQLSYAVIKPNQIHTNIVTACISAEVAGSASNLIQNIKPGYMLGGKPRLQAIGHVIGAASGALFSVTVYYWLFLPQDPTQLITKEYPYPSVITWKAVAELLIDGLKSLPVSAQWAALIGGVVGIVLETIRITTKGRFPISPIGIGLAFIVPFPACLAMFAGSFAFWFVGRLYPKPEQRPNRIIVQNQESICAGIIAGAALMGVALMAIIEYLQRVHGAAV
ncbi:MAG: OPT/YSL family transporter [Phycisphaerales bacterium]|nr:OPT/YSL family transporter [Phycisphaerales bacterium]